MLRKPHEAQSLSIRELTIVGQDVVTVNVYLIHDFYFTSGKG